MDETYTMFVYLCLCVFPQGCTSVTNTLITVAVGAGVVGIVVGVLEVSNPTHTHTYTSYKAFSYYD